MFIEQSDFLKVCTKFHEFAAFSFLKVIVLHNSTPLSLGCTFPKIHHHSLGCILCERPCWRKQRAVKISFCSLEIYSFNRRKTIAGRYRIFFVCQALCWLQTISFTPLPAPSHLIYHQLSPLGHAWWGGTAGRETERPTHSHIARSGRVGTWTWPCTVASRCHYLVVTAVCNGSPTGGQTHGKPQYLTSFGFLTAPLMVQA